MAISSPGVGSNLDVNSIVSQLMALERRPIVLLDQQSSSVQAKLSAFGTLKGALSTFQSAAARLAGSASFSTVKANVADATLLTASASSSAAAGTYNIDVSKLAQAQKLATAGQISSTAAIGTGTLTFDFGTIAGTLEGETGKYAAGATFTNSGAAAKTVVIDAAHSSLEGIRDAINSANIGVSASILNDGSGTPYRLTLSVAATGAASSLRISGGDAGLAALLGHDPAGTQNLTQTVAAQNAEFKLDGLAISKASNNVSDVIQGVSLTLLKTTTATTTMTVAKDNAGVKSSVDSFVKAFNDLGKTFTDLTRFDAVSKKASTLTGDATVRSIQGQLRAVLNQALDSSAGGLASLADIGVTFQADGTLKLDASKLEKVLADPTKDVATLFAAVGKPSDSLVKFATSTNDTQAGNYELKLTQLATQGKAVGSVAAGLTITADANDTLDLSVNGLAVSVKLTAGTYTAAGLASELQSKINGASALANAGVTVAVSESAGVLSVTSARFGSASKVAVSGGNAATGLFGSATSSDGLDVAGTIGGQAAVGSGQTLTASSGDAKGLAVTIAAGAVGTRGSVSFTKGFAVQLDKLVGKLLENDGMVDNRLDRINASVKEFAKRRESLESRMGQIEARFRTQFTALDKLVASMTATSNFLQQQLANLPKSSS